MESKCPYNIKILLFASQYWHSRGLQYDMALVESAPLRLFERLSSEPHAVVIKIASVLWAITFARNKIWDKKVLSPKVAMEWSRR